MATFVYPQVQTTISGSATEAKQDSQITELQAINTDMDTLVAVDYATQTTLAALLTELQLKADLSETQPVSAASLPLPTGASTSANQTTANASLSALENKLAASLVPEAYDHISLTYVAAGNGAGEIETVVYRTGGGAGTIVATLTLAYDGSNRLLSVTRS